MSHQNPVWGGPTIFILKEGTNIFIQNAGYAKNKFITYFAPYKLKTQIINPTESINIGMKDVLL